MKVESSESIILRQRDFKERDRLVTFLARDRGKLTGIARGAKVITGRGVGAYEPFTRCILYFVERPAGGLVSIRKCDLLPPYLYLRTDYERFLHFTYFTELIELSSIAPADSEAFFALLARGLERAAALPREALPLLRLEFELDVLATLGVQPEWKRCVACGRPIFARKREGIHPRRLATHQFDVAAGGLRCPDCREPRGARGRFDLAPGTLAQFAAWRAARRLTPQPPLPLGEGEPAASPLGPLSRGERGSEGPHPPAPSPKERGGRPAVEADATAPGLDAAARQELERAVRAHLLHRLERKPKSLDLLEEAERAAAGSGVEPPQSPAFSP